jgi:hypothetical protein
MEKFQVAAARMGIPEPTPHLERWVREAGFIDVKVKKYKSPWGPWARDRKLREIGKFMLLNCETAFEAYGLALLTRYAGMSSKEAKKLCDGAKRDAFNRNIHVYNFQYVPGPSFVLQLLMKLCAGCALSGGSPSRVYYRLTKRLLYFLFFCCGVS